jgi:hypothetical protein
MASPISTSNIGIDPDGNVEVYVPPGIIPQPGDSGISVEWGQGIGLSDGQAIPGLGIYLVVSGSLVADGAVQLIPVTITGSAP